ncbi:cache domain-containing protein [Helicobacter cynogastricus]|uniref:cache domain-containing protein n=1 Tax=Helicobacter cynogastricus TaxID=329937 RepID=UPI000CF0FAA8|nr:cache domain-containing protein [Helicobacter cynogastricus]
MISAYFKRINAAKGRLYILALSKEGVLIAGSIHPELLGKNVLKIQGARGDYFYKEFVQKALGDSKGGFYRCHLRRPVPKTTVRSSNA